LISTPADATNDADVRGGGKSSIGGASFNFINSIIGSGMIGQSPQSVDVLVKEQKRAKVAKSEVSMLFSYHSDLLWAG
jgi:hypothetical protein